MRQPARQPVHQAPVVFDELQDLLCPRLLPLPCLPLLPRRRRCLPRRLVRQEAAGRERAQKVRGGLRGAGSGWGLVEVPACAQGNAWCLHSSCATCALWQVRETVGRPVPEPPLAPVQGARPWLPPWRELLSGAAGPAALRGWTAPRALRPAPQPAVVVPGRSCARGQPPPASWMSPGFRLSRPGAAIPAARGSGAAQVAGPPAGRSGPQARGEPPFRGDRGPETSCPVTKVARSCGRQL